MIIIVKSAEYRHSSTLRKLMSVPIKSKNFKKTQRLIKSLNNVKRQAIPGYFQGISADC